MNNEIQKKKSVLLLAFVIVPMVLFLIAGILHKTRMDKQGTIDDIRLVPAYTGEEQNLFAIHMTHFENDEEAFVIPGHTSKWRIDLDHQDDSVIIESEDAGEACELKAGDILPDWLHNQSVKIALVDKKHQVKDELVAAFYFEDKLDAVFVTTDEELLHTEDKKERFNGTLVKLDRNGQLHSYGGCWLRDHGNSTWTPGKRSYNLIFPEQVELLSTSAVSGTKWVLMGNQLDKSQIKNAVALDIARSVGVEYEPEYEYVNFYCNGEWQGLYSLTQKVTPMGGSVTFETTNKSRPANGWLHNQQTWAYEDKDGENEQRYWSHAVAPVNHTGGYFLEFEDDSYYDESTFAYFMTEHKFVQIIEPQKASYAELHYISRLVRDTEQAIYANDGWREYLDQDSWERCWLVQDFLVQQDVSDGSLYFYKRKDDSLLYAGPLWDFDKGMTDSFQSRDLFPWYGTAPMTGWYKMLGEDDGFHNSVVRLYQNVMSSQVRKYTTEELPQMIEALSGAMELDDLRWNRASMGVCTEQWAVDVHDWINKRVDLFDAVWVRGEDSEYATNLN